MKTTNSSCFWYAVILALVVVLPTAGCGSKTPENKSDDSGGSQSNSDDSGESFTNSGDPDGNKAKPKAPDLSKAKPDFTLSSKDFDLEYKKDKKATAAKYKGKIVELSGRIVGFGKVDDEMRRLELDGRDSINSIPCYTAMKNPWLKATPGQTVKLRGMWPLSSSSPMLTHCHITDVSGDACPKLTADELAKDFDAGGKKYKRETFFILEGMIEKKETEKNGLVEVELKHSGKCKITCTFSAFQKEYSKPLAVGQKIRVIGKEMDSDEKKFSLFFCVLIKE